MKNLREHQTTTKRILFIPGNKAGMGSGHIRRCAQLAAALQEWNCESLFLENQAAGFLPLYPFIRDQTKIFREIPQAGKIDLIILDRRTTRLKEWQPLPVDVPVIGLDEGGKARDYLPYLIDTLPAPAAFSRPNTVAMNLRLQNSVQQGFRFPFTRILLSFGGEDRAGLTGKLLTVLLKKNLVPAAALTVVQGSYFLRQNWPEGIKLIIGPDNLPELLPDYDLLFTHFGLSCFEALAAGVAVILLNPTGYHRQLSRQCGLPEIGVRSPSARRLRYFLSSRTVFQKALQKWQPYFKAEKPGLTESVAGLSFSGSTKCPVCKNQKPRHPDPVLARFAGRTYYRCRTCGLLYLARFSALPSGLYNEDYFFTQYRKQYGKTYLEDFPKIAELAAGRVGELEKILPAIKNLRLLDIGCAYGPFLKVSHERGASVCGLDLCQSAITYVTQQLNLEAYCADFLKWPEEAWLGHGLFDIITMWFVIEHFPVLEPVLRKINRILRPGGIFAFSTPHSSGISARKSRENFLAASPQDHYTVWNPAASKIVLRKFGFRVQLIRLTGHHPERFPLSSKWQPGTLLGKGLTCLSKLAKLGDTFEVYARKVENIEN